MIPAFPFSFGEKIATRVQSSVVFVQEMLNSDRSGPSASKENQNHLWKYHECNSPPSSICLHFLTWLQLGCSRILEHLWQKGVVGGTSHLQPPLQKIWWDGHDFLRTWVSAIKSRSYVSYELTFDSHSLDCWFRLRISSSRATICW